jgi:hypothetical protein
MRRCITSHLYCNCYRKVDLILFNLEQKKGGIYGFLLFPLDNIPSSSLLNLKDTLQIFSKAFMMYIQKFIPRILFVSAMNEHFLTVSALQLFVFSTLFLG